MSTTDVISRRLHFSLLLLTFLALSFSLSSLRWPPHQVSGLSVAFPRHRLPHLLFLTRTLSSTHSSKPSHLPHQTSHTHLLTCCFHVSMLLHSIISDALKVFAHLLFSFPHYISYSHLQGMCRTQPLMLYFGRTIHTFLLVSWNSVTGLSLFTLTSFYSQHGGLCSSWENMSRLCSSCQHASGIHVFSSGVIAKVARMTTVLT